MLRLIGILTGSSIAIAVLIIALGIPEFSAPDEEPNKGVEPDYSEVLPAIEEPQQEPETVEQAVVAEADDEPEETAQPLDAETEELIEQIFAPQPKEDTVSFDEPVFDEPLVDEHLVDEPLVDENWYAFWSPFRSAIAADGFVAKLQESTGIDYRVVKVKTGVYEVAFAYHDEADIESKLALISSATGLDMSGG